MFAPIALNSVTGASAQNPNDLSSATAIERLKHDGYNEIPSARSRSLLAIAQCCPALGDGWWTIFSST